MRKHIWLFPAIFKTPYKCLYLAKSDQWLFLYYSEELVGTVGNLLTHFGTFLHILDNLLTLHYFVNFSGPFGNTTDTSRTPIWQFGNSTEPSLGDPISLFGRVKGQWQKRKKSNKNTLKDFILLFTAGARPTEGNDKRDRNNIYVYHKMALI